MCGSEHCTSTLRERGRVGKREGGEWKEGGGGGRRFYSKLTQPSTVFRHAASNSDVVLTRVICATRCCGLPRTKPLLSRNKWSQRKHTTAGYGQKHTSAAWCKSSVKQCVCCAEISDCGASELRGLHQFRRRRLVLVRDRQHQGRGAKLHVCVCKFVKLVCKCGTPWGGRRAQNGAVRSG